MSTTSRGAAAPPSSTWPTAYRGIGFIVIPLPDGTYQGFTEPGYVSRVYATAIAVLHDLSAWCDWYLNQGGATHGD